MTEVYISTINGECAAIRHYANNIAEMDPAFCNAYVMAFDKHNEILWTVQAGDAPDEVKAAINWQGVRRVEIYDHTVDGTYKVEQVYITSRKSLNEYTSERSAAEFRVAVNTTQYTADNWKEENDSDNTDENDNDNEGEQTPAEPSALAQKVAKVAENVKAYAVKAHALRSVLVLYMSGVFMAIVFSLLLFALPLLACFVLYAFLTSSSAHPKDVILFFEIESFFLAGGWSIWTLLKNGHIYKSWHDCKVFVK